MSRRAPAFLQLATVFAAAFLAQTSEAFSPAGRDAFDGVAVVRLAVPSINLPTTSFTLAGPTRVRRGDPYNFGDGRIRVDTEIEHMALSGVTPLGSALLRVMGAAPGEVQQMTAGTDFPASSWYDLKLEIILQTASGPTTVYSDPNTPVRIATTINALPALDAEYQPPAAFAGVNLVDRGGNVLGRLEDIRHLVGQQPTFSVAPGGPSGLAPGDLLRRPTTPAIRAARLGLTSGNVDALSYGRDFIFRQFTTFPSLIDVRFSVARGSVGRPGTHVAREAAKSPPEAHGDEFRVTPFAGLGGGNNVQVLDENGSTAPGFPLQINDELDALTEHPPSLVDDGDGIPDRTVFFSLQSGSPELAAIGANGATILASVRGGAPTIYYSHTDLGLAATDDIDAICLSEVGRSVVFSLAPGSPSLAGRSPADLFMVIGAPSPFFPWATAANLGLQATDNVDALKCHYGEIARTWEAQVSMDVLRSGTFVKRVELPCDMELTFASFNGDAGVQGASGRLPFVFSNLSCNGMDGGQPVSFGLRSAAPAVLPSGSVFGQRNSDLMLTGSGAGTFFLTPNVNGWGIMGGHGPQPITFSTSFTNGFLGELPRFKGTASAPYNLFLEGGVTTDLAIANVVLEYDARDPATFSGAGFSDAGGFGPNPSRGGLASLFGGFATELETAGAIPLPRRAGNNVQVLFEAQGGVAALSDGAGGKQQAGATLVPAPLLFVAPTQINMQIPWEARVNNGQVTATVVIDGVRSAPVQLPVAPTSPGVFTADFGVGRAIAINTDRTLAQPVGSIENSHPAAAGDTLVILVTGLGDTNPAGVTGANSYDPTGVFVRRDTVGQERVLIGGVEARVDFAGLSPEFVGVFQLNAVVPAGVTPGDAVPLVVEIGGRRSRADVTIAVRAAP